MYVSRDWGNSDESDTNTPSGFVVLEVKESKFRDDRSSHKSREQSPNKPAQTLGTSSGDQGETLKSSTKAIDAMAERM